MCFFDEVVKKKYLIFMVILCFVGGAKGDPSDEPDEQALISLIKNKCVQNGGVRAFGELKNSARKFWQCVERKLITYKPKTEDEALHAFCTDVHPSVFSCLSVIFNKLEPCLANDEKYLPDLLSYWLNSTFEAHCRNDGRAFRANFETLRNYRCTNGSRDVLDYISERCYTKSTFFKDQKNANSAIPQNGFCSYLEHGNQCVIDYVKKYCDESFADYVESHLKLTKTWCKKYVASTANN